MKTFFLFGILSAVSLYGHGVHELIDSLDKDQKQLLQKDFESSERTQWHYVPKKQRKGIRIGDMSEAQYAKMLETLKGK